MLNSWIILDKPVGLGSTSAVGAIKRILREAGEPMTKVGHGGTLDPLASGVLPIALGEATKLAGRMLDCDHQSFPAGTLRKILGHEWRDLGLLSHGHTGHEAQKNQRKEFDRHDRLFHWLSRTGS